MSNTATGTKKIIKTGSSLAITIPSDIVAYLCLREGDTITFTITKLCAEGAITI